MTDFRYALRQLRKAPSLSATAIFALALGIGATTAMFAVLYAFLLRPLPFATPEQLVMLQSRSTRSGSDLGVNYLDFKDWQNQARSFSEMAFFNLRWNGNLEAPDGTTETLKTTFTTANLFHVLGVQPVLGRNLAEADDQPDAGKVVLISHRLWRRMFAGSESAIGRMILLDGSPSTIVGVMPPDFRFPSQTDLWVPMARVFGRTQNRSWRADQAIGRLRQGATAQQAQSEMTLIAERLAQQYPDTNKEIGAAVVPLREHWTGGVRHSLLLLLAGCGGVLLIACANVSQLLLARATTHERELAVRAALGASGWRLARQVLVESALLAFFGSVAGVILAFWITELVATSIPIELPFWIRIELDPSVLAFAVFASGVTALLAGVLPARQSARIAISQSLKAAGAGYTGGAGTGARAREILTITQVAASMILLVGASLVLRSMLNLREVDPGFDPRGVLMMEVNPTYNSEESAQTRVDRFTRVLERLKQIPGVEAVANNNSPPFVPQRPWNRTKLVGEGQPADAQSLNPAANFQTVSADYFTALRIPLRSGRFFNAQDKLGALPVCLVSQRLAHSLWPGQDAIGRRLQPEAGADDEWLTVVGVVGDVRHQALDGSAGPDLYKPSLQLAWKQMHFLVRAREGVAPLSLAPAVRRAVAEVAPEVGVFNFTSLEKEVADSLWQQRLQGWLLGFFSIVALTLAAAGLYGAVAYGVAQRTREIGIRIALGATRARVLRLVMGQGMRAVAIGLLLGSSGAALVAQGLRATLFGIGGADYPELRGREFVAAADGEPRLPCARPARRARQPDGGAATRVNYMLNDIRYGFRQLLKHPGFTIVAVLTLALGIGANTAIFSVVNSVLLKPLPFPEPAQLLAFGSTNTRDGGTSEQLNSLSYPDFFDYRAQNRTLQSVAIYRDRTFAVADAEGAQSVRGLTTSAEFFDVLGIKPILGRAFARADEQAGGGPGGLKVILSNAFWRSHFGGDRDVLGRTIALDRQQYTVLGVMPPQFQFPIQNEPIDLYATIAEDAASSDGSKPVTESRGSHSMRGLARLKPGVAVEQAQSDLSNIAAQLEKQFPDTNSYFGARVKLLREDLIGDVRTGLYVLFGAVLCVLLIANANVANLLLARASVRGKEMALRAAMGASRMRIVRQLLTEALLLAGLGGLLGLLFAQWGTEALVRVVPGNIPRLGEIHLDPLVLVFTLLVSLGTGIVFGLVPAWQASRVDLNAALKSGSRTGGGGERKGRLRNALVVAEVALALVLLISAGLLIQSFARLGRVDTGVHTERLLTARISLPSSAYPKNEDTLAFFRQLMPRIRALPGVESASLIVPLPLSGSNMVTDFDIEEHPLSEGQRAAAPVRIIANDYFKTMGIQVKQGRVFADTDRLDSTPVTIVNERWANKYFPGQNVLGKRIQPGFSADDSDPKMREIVGVVGNVKHLSLSKDETPEMYLPHTQIPFGNMSLVVRTKVSDPGALTSAIRAALSAADPNLPLTSVRVFEEYISRSLARPRFNALLLSIFAGTALLLTAIGIYGVMAYSVAQRTNEIGIRIALGAEQSSIFRLIVGQAMMLVGISVALGLVGAFAATRLLNSLLYGVGAADPITFSIIVVLVSVVAFLAAWLPARRAANVDPIVALRAE